MINERILRQAVKSLHKMRLKYKDMIESGLEQGRTKLMELALSEGLHISLELQNNFLACNILALRQNKRHINTSHWHKWEIGESLCIFDGDLEKFWDIVDYLIAQVEGLIREYTSLDYDKIEAFVFACNQDAVFYENNNFYIIENGYILNANKLIKALIETRVNRFYYNFKETYKQAKSEASKGDLKKAIDKLTKLGVKCEMPTLKTLQESIKEL